MNIRGTDPTAINTVADLILPTAARKDDSRGFERALQPPPAANSPSPGPAPSGSSRDREPATCQAPPPAKKSDNQKAPAASPTDEQSTTETAQTKNQVPAKGDTPPDDTSACASDAPVDEASGDDETADDDVPAADALAQTLVAAQQVHAEQVQATTATKPVVIADQKAESAAEVEPAAEVSTEQVPAAVVTPVTTATKPAIVAAVNTSEAQNQAAKAIDPVEPFAEAVTEPLAEAVTELAPAETESTAAGASKGTPAVGVPTAIPVAPPRAASERGNTPSTNGRKQAPVAGTAQPTEQAAAGTPEITAESDAHHERDPDEDRTGTQRQIPGAAPDALNLPKAAAEAQPVPDATNNISAAEAPPPAATTDSNSPPPARPDAAVGAAAPANPAAAIIQRLPTHALVRHAAPPQAEGAPVQVDAARFLQRVARAFESARERGGEIRLRLSPPELGALTVNVTMQDQGMTARIEVETPEARAALMENLPVLRERLAEQNLRIERFDVDLSQRDSQQPSHDFTDQQAQRQAQAQARQPRAVPTRPLIPPNIPTQVATPAGMQDRQLNVIV